MTAIRVGGDIDAHCNRCELNLAHTILAMVGPKVVKVRCNTCGSDHQYRGVQPLMPAQSFARPAKRASTTKAAAPRATTWEDKFQGRDISRARRYSPRDTYAVDDVVDHPTFGLGLVLAVRGDKVDISFKQTQKTLVHGKAPPPTPDAPSA